MFLGKNWWGIAYFGAKNNIKLDWSKVGQSHPNKRHKNLLASSFQLDSHHQVGVLQIFRQLMTGK